MKNDPLTPNIYIYIPILKSINISQTVYDRKIEYTTPIFIIIRDISTTLKNRDSLYFLAEVDDIYNLSTSFIIPVHVYTKTL